jgi:hypothetical protein
MIAPPTEVNPDPDTSDVVRMRRRKRTRSIRGALLCWVVGAMLAAGFAAPAIAEPLQPEASEASENADAAALPATADAADALADTTPGISVEEPTQTSELAPEPRYLDVPGFWSPGQGGPVYEEPPYGYDLEGEEFMVTDLAVVSFGEGTATLSWTLPSFEETTGPRVNHRINVNGLVVTRYCVPEFSGGCWMDNQPPYVISDLVPGQEYTVAIRAGFRSMVPEGGFGHLYGKPVFLTFTMPEGVPSAPGQTPEPSPGPTLDPATGQTPDRSPTSGPQSAQTVPTRPASVTPGSPVGTVELARTGIDVDELVPWVMALIASGSLLLAARRLTARGGRS